MKLVRNDRSISLSSKIRLMRSLVTSVVLYACESWTLTAELQRRIQAMEMRCYRKILRISKIDHVTNEKVRAKIQQAIEPHEDLLTIVKRRKLNWLWTRLMFIMCGQNDLAKHSESGKRKGGKTTSANGQAWSSTSSRRQWRTGENGGNWL